MKRFLLTLVLITLSALASAQTHVELILDASGSMWNKLENGSYRIVAAKEVLSDFVSSLPNDPSLNVGLRIYGSQMEAIHEDACKDSELFVPIEGIARNELLTTVQETTAKGATPIAYSLQLAAQDFPTEGKKVLILVTDGEESCGGDVRGTLESLKAQGIEFDLNIIGFDLNDTATQSFEGLGTFVNATSATELAEALGQVISEVVEEETMVYPVTALVTLNDEPVNATVLFASTVTSTRTDLPASELGTHRSELDAGSYSAVVTTEGLTQSFSGLNVIPDGENIFRLELRTLDVALTVPDQRFLAGGRITVNYEEAPAFRGDLIALAPAGTPDSVFLSPANVQIPSGEVKLSTPDEVGTFEARYYLTNDDGSRRLIARSNSFTTKLPEISLSAVNEVIAGTTIEISYEGNANPEDYILITPVDKPEHTLIFAYAVQPTSNPVNITVPNEAGSYEIRYQLAKTRRVLAKSPLQVTNLSVTLTASEEAYAGSMLEVTYQGTTNPDDYIAIVPAGSGEGTLTFAFATQLSKDNNPLNVSVPGKIGEYELRYVTGGKKVVYAAYPLTVLPLEVRLSAASEAEVGGRIEVLVEGTFNPTDFIAIVPAGSPESTLRANFSAKITTNPVTINLPRDAGHYEIRYMTITAGRTVYASIPLTLR